MRKIKKLTIFLTIILTVLCNTIGVGAWTMDFPETWPGTKQELKFTDSDGNERTIEWGQNYGRQMEDPVYVSKAAAAWAGLRAGGINEVMAAAVIGSLTMESGFNPYICGDQYGNNNKKCDTVKEYEGGANKKAVEHSFIQFNSNYKTYRYKIFAVCVVDTEKESDVLGDAHNRHNFENNADFKQFVADCKERSQYDTGVNVRNNAPLLTLSTCTSWEGSSLRMIVVAALEEYTF